MMVWMLVGSFIAFLDLLDHDDSDAIPDIEQDAPVADAHSVTVFVAGQRLYVPAIRPVPEGFCRIKNLLPGLPAPDLVKLPIGLSPPVDVVHGLLYKLKYNLLSRKMSKG
jgi:hypothetical protein